MFGIKAAWEMAKSAVKTTAPLWGTWQAMDMTKGHVEKLPEHAREEFKRRAEQHGDRRALVKSGEVPDLPPSPSNHSGGDSTTMASTLEEWQSLPDNMPQPSLYSIILGLVLLFICVVLAYGKKVPQNFMFILEGVSISSFAWVLSECVILFFSSDIPEDWLDLLKGAVQSPDFKATFGLALIIIFYCLYKLLIKKN